MTRFNDPIYLDNWRRHGVWPVIHSALFDFAVSRMRGSRLLDLGCSHGLLGARIALAAGAEVAVGVDVDLTALTAGEAAGVPVTFRQMAISRETVPELLGLIRGQRLTVIIARRILPELFSEDLELGREFAAGVRAAGVTEIFLQGRVGSSRSVNALWSVEQEVELLAGAFLERRRLGALSHLAVAAQP